VDAAATVAVGLVALAVVLAGVVWRRRRGGIRIDLRVWWDDLDPRDPGSENGTGPGQDGSADQ
jgi:MYXO-CTERM domain-containing protein